MLGKWVVIIIGFAFFISCSAETDVSSGATWEDGAAEEPPLAVEVLEVSEGRLIPYVEGAGIISGIREAWVISETQGIIETVDFEIGDVLEKGDVLLEVDDDILRLSMEQARQQYETALLDLNAAETFYRQGNASQAELNRARSAAAGAKAAFESAQKKYEDTSVKAPISGAVAWKSGTAALGNYMSPSVQVARLVDLSRIKVELSFGERQIGLIREGAEVSIFVDSVCKEGLLTGRVTAVSAGSDLSTGSYSVIVESENDCEGPIRAGMSARVRIPVRGGETGIIVPDSSVVVRDGKEYVFVEKGGKAEPHEIERGETVGNRTEVLLGVELGDRLIVSGLSALKPGAPVRGTLIGKTGEVL